MEETNFTVARQLLERIRLANNDENVHSMVTSLKSEFESLPLDYVFVTERIKAPLSALRKFTSDTKYNVSWARMKDIIGLMVVVNNNHDVDFVLEYITKKYSNNQNPFSRKLFHDYRKDNFIKDKGIDAEELPAYDPPSNKGYQTCNGYKNVRANIVLSGYPVEIQVKTKEQYIAHFATHAPVYKSPLLSEESEKSYISACLFPYFEALAHLQLYKQSMSNKEINQVETDIENIFKRNLEIFNKYPKIYNDACITYAISSFILKNEDKIYKDIALKETVLNNKLIECEIERVFNYTKKQIQLKDPNLKVVEVFRRTVDKIADMSYNEFDKIRKQIAGNFRLKTCVLSGIFDLLRQKDLELIKKLSESYKHVEVAVYNKELVELVTGRPPMFSTIERREALELMTNVSATTRLDLSAKIKLKNEIAPLFSKENPEIIYDVGYLPGVFDMLHPGHLRYIKQASSLCKTLIVGVKTDEYSQRVKGKYPVISCDERKYILYALRNTDKVVKTDCDITPPPEVLKHLVNVNKKGGKSVIFLGSDWLKKPNVKPQSSLEELNNLKQNYSEIVLTSLPREVTESSSTNYREKGLERLNDINPCEVIDFGE